MESFLRAVTALVAMILLAMVAAAYVAILLNMAYRSFMWGWELL